MDKLQWFKFSILDWNMGKIQRAPEITQLRFIRLCCLYWNKECDLSVEDAEIEIDKEHLDILLTRKIVKADLGFIKIQFLDEQFVNVLDNSEKRREAANKRWAKVDASALQTDASALQDINFAMQNDAEKRRVDKNRKEIDKTLLSEIKISDDNKFLIAKGFQIPQTEISLKHFTIAEKFRQVFIKNLKAKGSPTTHQEKATYKAYVSEIRLMLENDGVTMQNLLDAYNYLNSDDELFWKNTILSASTLRKNISKVLISKT